MNKYFLKYISLQVCIAAVLGSLINICFPEYIWWSYFAGAVLWTILVCFTGTGDMFSIYLSGGYAIALENSLRKEDKFVKRSFEEARQMSGIKPRYNKRGVLIIDINIAMKSISNPFSQLRVIYGPKLVLKAPWEKNYKQIAINLGALIEVRGSIETTTKDGVSVVVEFLVILSVIRIDECIISLINQGVDKAKSFFQQSAENYFEVEVRKISVDQLFAQIASDSNLTEGNAQKKIKDGFLSLWGGKGVICPDEWDYGLYSNEPTCKFKLSPKYQEALQLKETMRRVNEAVSALNQNGVKIREDVAINYVAANQGLTPPVVVSDNNINITGAGNAKHIHLITGAGIIQPQSKK